jgi:rhodanese-related sulfurtransferase
LIGASGRQSTRLAALLWRTLKPTVRHLSRLVQQPVQGRFSFDVAGMVNIPLSELELRWQETPHDRPVVFVCESGARSLKATYFLQYQGRSNVCNMGSSQNSENKAR